MVNYSAKSMSAFLYVVAQNTVYGPEGILRAREVLIDDSVDWLSLVKAELLTGDQLSTSSGSSLHLELGVADEGRALQVARLMRNSFQLHQTPASKARLSIGVVLYSANTREKSKFMKIAESLAFESLALNNGEAGGNRIAFEDCTGSQL